MVVDDMGTAVPLPQPATRVVSLVPSLTEAIAASCPGVLVGATDFCTHPADLNVARVRGTKNPDIAQIVALTPDLVVCNQEENRAIDVERLRTAGIPVWVTVIDTVDEAFTSLRRLIGEGLDGDLDWLAEAERAWAAPAPTPTVRVAVPIWRDPWIWVGSQTYAADVLRRRGAAVVTDQDRYPHMGLDAMMAHRPDVVLLPNEPYAFTEDDAGELAARFPDAYVLTVDGRHLFWYGPAMAAAPDALRF